MVTKFTSVDDPAVTLTTGYASFTGTTKCTYIIQVGPEGGAPSFKINAATTTMTMFDLHYIEFENSEMDFLNAGANAVYQGTTFEKDVFPNPMADKATLTPGQHLNWYPQNYYPGQHYQFLVNYNKYLK